MKKKFLAVLHLAWAESFIQQAFKAVCSEIEYLAIKTVHSYDLKNLEFVLIKVLT